MMGMMGDADSQYAATVCDQLTQLPLNETTTPASLSLYLDDAILISAQ
jgi:hypothetical protein